MKMSPTWKRSCKESLETVKAKWDNFESLTWPFLSIWFLMIAKPLIVIVIHALGNMKQIFKKNEIIP